MSSEVTGIVLAGGQGRRAGGADKGLLPWHGGTRIEALLAVLRPQVGDIVISANRNLARYRQLAGRVVEDALPGHQGPLAGIASALAAAATELAVVVPCDCPNPPRDLVARLLECMASASADLAYAHDGARHQYLFCALSAGCLESLNGYLAEGGRAVRGWHRRIRCGIADFSDCPENFANHNQPE